MIEHDRVAVLDHGYCQLIEHWGSDERIVEAARMSTGKGFRTWEAYHECADCGLWWLPTVPSPCTVHAEKDWRFVPNGDMGLLRYLWTEEPKHTTPFEMAGMIVEVQAPIMVFREWHRHRTFSYNEMSGRYAALPDLNYVPSVERMLVNSKTNKQAGVIKGADELDATTAERLRGREAAFNIAAEEFYQEKLQAGVPKELARTHVGVNRYSRMRTSANLLNWLKFVTLRSHKKAQWEIRQFSDQVGNLLAVQFPRTWELFVGGLKAEAYPFLQEASKEV